MNEKTAKKLRKLARTALKSSKIKGPDRQYFMLNRAGLMGATEKQAKRAVRLVSAIFYQKTPDWAQRLVHNRRQRQFIRIEA
jgi:hypothetical protein